MGTRPLPRLSLRSRIALAAAAILAAYLTVSELPRTAPVPAAAAGLTA